LVGAAVVAAVADVEGSVWRVIFVVFADDFLAGFLAADFFMWTPQRQFVGQQPELKKTLEHELGLRPV